ncbi:MAG: Dihydroneopterin aldolase [Cytophagales bacterium]|jgi:dihydroneopterin aldolase|nr:dihydroneopterin aldolase [Bacteroidota bacterium]MBS1980517.1 dihydroneopterin aldolase [Bacteroidota bacterium]WHZ07835.1 MAG: Dihydroneopterin aldolase [Cytophagales bacterium]
MTGKISLEGLEFHAYHGVYPHERSSGNKFEVDVVIETTLHHSAFQDDLRGTINYEDLYAVVKDEMEKPSKLLETVAHNIAEKILQQFAGIINAEVKISKFNPPIGGVCKKASVSVARHKA